jgi:hypothetical protein
MGSGPVIRFVELLQIRDYMQYNHFGNSHTLHRTRTHARAHTRAHTLPPSLSLSLSSLLSLLSSPVVW